MDLFQTAGFTHQVEDMMEQWHVPGLAIALVQQQKVVSKAFGKASIDPPQPCTPDTIFDIASSSKSLTAGSVALLVHDDERYPDVKWDTPMCNLLPDDFVMSEESYTKDVTVEDVLSHRTGLPSHDYSYLGPSAQHPDDAKSITRNLRNLGISAPIRTKSQYCNLMLTVATYLVEKMTGSSFGDFLSKHFFQPLNMSSTHLQPDAAIEAGLKGRMATGHVWDEKESKHVLLPPSQEPEAQGAGAIWTSANDHIKWVKALMNREHPITEDIYEGMTSVRSIVDPASRHEKGEREPRTSWKADALGLELRYYRGHQIIQHDGLNYGFGSTHFFVPEIEFGGTILGNCNEANDLASVLSRVLIDEALEIPIEKRPAWNNMAKGTARRAERDEEAERAKLRKELCGQYDRPQPQTMPLAAYTGLYSNAGYHELQLVTKDSQLFADGSDRSMGFYLTFEHMRNQTEYLAHFSDALEGGDILMPARFRFEDGTVSQMGVKLEADLHDMIWFDKVKTSQQALPHGEL